MASKGPMTGAPSVVIGVRFPCFYVAQLYGGRITLSIADSDFSTPMTLACMQNNLSICKLKFLNFRVIL